MIGKWTILISLDVIRPSQSQIQDFPKGAAPFVSSAKSTRFSGGGGGVVAEIFRALQKPTRFSGGRGSSRIFRRLQNPTRRDSVGEGTQRDAIQWGRGVVLPIFG